MEISNGDQPYAMRFMAIGLSGDSPYILGPRCFEDDRLRRNAENISFVATKRHFPTIFPFRGGDQ